MKARLLFWICVVIIAPFLALFLIELVMRTYGVFPIDPFLTGLKQLDAEQAHMIHNQIFLVALGIVLLVVVGLMIYGIVSIFEILGQEPAQRTRKSISRLFYFTSLSPGSPGSLFTL